MKLLNSKISFIIFCLLCSIACGPLTAVAAKAEKAVKGPMAEKTLKGSMAEKVPKPNAVFDASKMSDMSDFDPANWISPTGDTIKIAVVDPFSGSGAANGANGWLAVTWVAHDINKRGGIWVDGKRKLIEVIKADSMSKQDQCKKVCERMVLQEKVHVLWGTAGSNMMKIINETANKYKIIAHNNSAMADSFQDAENFGRYSFMSTASATQIGRSLAYYYGQIRKKEKKFYVLCQDYGYGHDIADGFTKGLKDYYPEAQVVGEDYHKLFITDFAPYLTKIQASGAEVIFTGDWVPDGGNLLKQARQMNIMLPFANIFLDDSAVLHEVGIKGSEGLVHSNQFSMPSPVFASKGMSKFYKAWHDQWQNKWKTAPYNSHTYEWGSIGMAYVLQTYWLMSVIERAKSTDPEKIIKVWEGDTYQYPNGKILKMRACDHRGIQDFTIEEYVTPDKQKVSVNIPPYYWYKGASAPGPGWLVPASKALPPIDRNLDRCKGKNEWGD